MGRPKKYQTEEELSQAIEEYFTDIAEKKEIPNKAALCRHLSISRETYSQYRKEFPDTIKETDYRIENAWVQRLAGNAPTGAIFYLKNAFGYRDRQETDLTTKGEKIAVLPAELYAKRNPTSQPEPDSSGQA